MLLLVLTSVAALSAGHIDSPNPSLNAVPGQLVCKNEQITASRIGVFHVCMSQRDWDARADNARGFLAEFQNRSAIQLTK